MRQLIPALLASAGVTLASQTVFSVHDDLLAFPQFEVVFSDTLISDTDANLLIEGASSSIHDPAQSANTKDVQSHGSSTARDHPDNYVFDSSKETYELMRLHGEQYLCIIPIVDTPPKNETSEAEARAAEQKELARATDRGWELLQDLEGDCLYFISGWWSYSFCYNAEITQFHQLPPQPGRPPYPPQRDPTTKSYVLGKARTKQSREDEWGNEVDIHKGQKATVPPATELQVKGDAKYLVQKMEGGTTCDLTGKPRRVEVRYHCNPHVTDRIGHIKEVTTCSYLMVIHTPRLCNDIAFMPPKESKANVINCRMIVPEDEITYRSELKTLEAELAATGTQAEPPINIGGVILGGAKYVGKEGQRMPMPANFAVGATGTATEVIARMKGKAEGGKFEMLSEEELQKLDLKPEMVEQLKDEIQKIAGEKGWRLEIVDVPGDAREIRGVVDGEDEDEGDEVEVNGSVSQNDEDDSEGKEGSEEIFKEDL